MERIKSIYSAFCDDINRIENFLHTTQAAYLVTNGLLPQYSSEDIENAKRQLLVKPEREKMSYCAADRKIEGVDLLCEWITLAEYAEREQTDIASVQQLIADQTPDIVTEKDGITYIIWPPSAHSTSPQELPKLGKKRYQVRFLQKAASSLELSNPSLEQSIALTNQTPESMETFTDKATSYLYELCFTSIWSAFEVFIKQLIYALIDIAPDKMFERKKIAAKTISYLDVFQKSSKLSSIDELKTHLVSSIIAEQEDAHESIHSLINLIKDCYLPGCKPYDTWYVFMGQKKNTSYRALLTVKDARNSLMHDKQGGNDNKSSSPAVIINEQTYDEYVLILRAIAHHVVSLLKQQLPS